MDPARLLELWDQVWARPPDERWLALVADVVCPGQPLALLSVGQCEQQALEMRRRLFGDQASAVTACPTCSANMELTFRMSELAVSYTYDEGDPQRWHTFDWNGRAVRWRRPCAADLAALRADASPEAQRSALLASCVQQQGLAAEGVEACSEPEELAAELGRVMSADDPLADIRFDLTCGECGSEWQVLFDAGTFLWREIDSWARRLLDEVHALASAYGWSQQEILALSPARRGYYLELLGA